MLHRGLSAALVLFVLGGFLLAGTYTGLVTKVEDGKITVKTFKKGEEPTEKTFKVSKDVKITKKKSKDDEGEAVKVEDFTKAVEKAAKGEGKFKGVFAKIETEGEGSDETVTKITSFAGKKGKAKKKDE
jgi:hypothetical protein